MFFADLKLMEQSKKKSQNTTVLIDRQLYTGDNLDAFALF